MPSDACRALDAARRRADLSVRALHMRYVALGGTATWRQLTEHLASGAGLGGIEGELVVQSINERFLELEMAERLPFGSGGAPD